MEKTIEMKGMDLGMLFGPADANLKLLEDAFASKIIVRGNIIKIDGDKKEVPVIHEVFHEMGSTLNRKGSLTQDDVKALIRITAMQNGHESSNWIRWFIMDVRVPFPVELMDRMLILKQSEKMILFSPSALPGQGKLT